MRMRTLWAPALILWGIAAVWLGNAARFVPASHAFYVWGGLVCAFGLAVFCFWQMYQTARLQKEENAKRTFLLYLGLSAAMLAAAVALGRLPAEFVLV